MRGFTQDDGHIFCLPEQITAEVAGVLDFVEEVMSAFGFRDLEVCLLGVALTAVIDVCRSWRDAQWQGTSLYWIELQGVEQHVRCLNHKIALVCLCVSNVVLQVHLGKGCLEIM